MKRSRTGYALINTGFAILSRLVSIGFGFIQKTVFIRTLGMTYTGVSGLFTDILTVLSLAELGIGSAVAYSLYKPIAENDYRRIAQLMNFFKKAYTYIALIVMCVGLALLPILNLLVKNVPDVSEDIRLIFMLYIANTAVTYLLVYKNTLLIAAQKQYVVSNIQMLYTVIGIVVQCVTLLIFKDFLLYLSIQIFFSLFQNITINLTANRYFPELKRYNKERISINDKKRLFKDVRALMLYKIANVITNGTDSSIISAGIGVQSVGVLGNYRTLSGYVMSFVAQFYNALNPSLGNLAATSKKETQYKIFKKIQFGTFWVACFSSTCFFVLFNPFIKIWLHDDMWLLDMGTVTVFVANFFLSVMMHSTGCMRLANGLYVQTKYIALAKAILNLVISIILVKPLGIMGVLLGTIISTVLTQFIFEPIIIYNNVFEMSAVSYYKEMLFYVIITVISGTVVFFTSNIVAIENPWWDFVVRAVLCLITPNIIITAIYARTEEYRECVGLLFRGIKKKLKK